MHSNITKSLQGRACLVFSPLRVGTKLSLAILLATSSCVYMLMTTIFLPRDALLCKARYCDRMSSVRPSVRDVGGS